MDGVSDTFRPESAATHSGKMSNILFSFSEESSSEVESSTCWIYQEELSNETLFYAEAQGFFSGRENPLSDVSAGTGLHEALTLGSGFLKQTFESLRRREAMRHVSFNMTTNMR